MEKLKELLKELTMRRDRAYAAFLQDKAEPPGYHIGSRNRNWGKYVAFAHSVRRIENILSEEVSPGVIGDVCDDKLDEDRNELFNDELERYDGT